MLLKKTDTTQRRRKWKQLLLASVLGTAFSGVCSAQQANTLAYPPLPGQPQAAHGGISDNGKKAFPSLLPTD